jgi:hypothetical protein
MYDINIELSIYQVFGLPVVKAVHAKKKIVDIKNTHQTTGRPL